MSASVELSICEVIFHFCSSSFLVVRILQLFFLLHVNKLNIVGFGTFVRTKQTRLKCKIGNFLTF